MDLPETATRGLVEVARGRVDRQLRVVDGHVAVPRAVSSRPTPGDTIPELRSDPATTIPFPVARRRYPSEEERRQGERKREQQATPRRFGRDATPPEPGGTTAGLRSPESQGTEAPRPPEAEARTGARPAGASGERGRPSPLWERPQPQERAVEGERRVRDRESAPPSADREVPRAGDDAAPGAPARGGAGAAAAAPRPRRARLPRHARPHPRDHRRCARAGGAAAGGACVRAGRRRARRRRWAGRRITASYLARAGLRTLVLERAVHPRPHVGESLLCSTTRVFQEIGVLDAIERGGFVRKAGALWTHHADARERRLAFEPIPRLGVAQPFTWHVDRARFDRLLLDHARVQGAEVQEGVRAVEAELAQQTRGSVPELRRVPRRTTESTPRIPPTPCCIPGFTSIRKAA